jgi:hypothetical protein
MTRIEGLLTSEVIRHARIARQRRGRTRVQAVGP